MRWTTLLLLPCCLVAADWPQWRGVNRDAKSPETGLLKQWPSAGPKLVWKANGLGEGYSTVTVVAGVIYTQGQRGDTEYIMAFDAASGKKLWETANGGAYRERRGDGPRGVPTVEGDVLWAEAADGTLSCLNNKTGKRVWSKNAVKDFGGDVPHWGYSESPLIDGKNLIFNAGGRGTAVMALDKLTGSPVWKSQSDPAAYSSAIVAQVGTVKQVLTMTSKGALAVRADNGEFLWRYDQIANRTANIATPIFHNNAVFYSTDYGTGCALLKLAQDGGGVKMTEAYFNRDMKNHHASSILVGDHLYGFSSQILTAMKWDTGEVAWRDRSVGKGSLVYADGRFVALSENAVVGLIEATPTAYKEISRFTFPKSDWPTWANPVISGGKLYIRDQDVLYSYDIKQ